jgi:hypothetical protein
LQAVLVLHPQPLILLPLQLFSYVQTPFMEVAFYPGSIGIAL